MELAFFLPVFEYRPGPAASLPFSTVGFSSGRLDPPGFNKTTESHLRVSSDVPGKFLSPSPAPSGEPRIWEDVLFLDSFSVAQGGGHILGGYLFIYLPAPPCCLSSGPETNIEGTFLRGRSQVVQ